nr:sensor histidine kinase [Kytococcus aerolatus]
MADLSDVDLDWLRLLVGDWQVLADLSLADLILWVRRPGRDGAPEEWSAVAHARPTTAPLVFVEDVVGRRRPGDEQMDWAAARGGRVHVGAREVRPGTLVDEDVVGIRTSRHARRCVAVLTRHTPAAVLRSPHRLEQQYRVMADDLLTMVSEGEFPTVAAATGRRRGAPRVGDGVIHLDAEGTITSASPNAVSALHRTGVGEGIVGQRLLDLVSDLPRTASSSLSPVDEGLPVVLAGRAAWWAEIDTGVVQVAVRAIPVVIGGRRTGAVVLLRDVTSLRRGEEALLSHEASVREVHHRVKNSLQTVTALLRLQVRRVEDPAAREALETAMHRLGAISVVHESLAQTAEEEVDLDPVVDRVVRSVTELAREVGEGGGMGYQRRGSLGRMPSERASAVAMVVSELAQNVVTHAAASQVVVEARRARVGEHRVLEVSVEDDGAGMTGDRAASGTGLGRQIVEALVADLGGTIRWESARPQGTRAVFTVAL